MEEKIRPSFEYLPHDYQLLAQHIMGEGEGNDEELTKTVQAFSLRAARETEGMPQEKMEQEYTELCSELYAEYLKEQREVLTQKVRSAERNGQEEDLGALLKQFDELSKLMQNRL